MNKTHWFSGPVALHCLAVAITLLLILLSGCTPSVTAGFAGGGTYDDATRSYWDETNGRKIRLVQFVCFSRETRGSWPRFTLKMDLIEFAEEGTGYQARFVLRSSPEEWPLDTTVHLLIDKSAHQFALRRIDPKNTTQLSGMSSSDGDVSISTKETQLFRMEATMPSEIFDGITDGSQVRFVFHSGVYPVTFVLEPRQVEQVMEFVK